MKLKVGDLLYCHNSIKDVKFGEYYTVTSLYNTLVIRDNKGSTLGFDKNNYKKIFYTIKDLRQIKLKKLHENN